MSEELVSILAYHKASKHNFNAYAPGPRRLDMAIKPNLFLSYRGARLLQLETESEKELKAKSFPAYEQAFSPGQLRPAVPDRQSISRLFFDSFAISVWRKTGNAKWPLRINPSSGNLHPTEVYLLSGPVEGLLKKPSVCHYAPLPHALELRAEVPPKAWKQLSSGFPEGTFFVGLSSIHWRVAWKYGVRAFRYSNHDIGHAIAALSFAAAGLGWEASLLEGMSSKGIAALLGISGSEGPEKEEPACLLAVYPAGKTCSKNKVCSDAVLAFEEISWEGSPNRLSPRHVEWVDIEKAVFATRKGETDYPREKKYMGPGPEGQPELPEKERGKGRGPALERTVLERAVLEGVSLRSMVHTRRSALEMNNSAYMEEETFYGILRRSLPEPHPPFNALVPGPFVHLLLFVNRVKGLRSGLYIFLRKSGEKEKLRTAMRNDFLWERPEICPPGLELYLLVEESLYYFAAQLSCAQRKAADACFTACMLSEFEEPLGAFGAWIYPYLFWECGVLGQLLYLEAEARGFRGCGIGCFFDDPLHDTLGLAGLEYQDLYHFAVGVPLPERGFLSLPAYPERGRKEA
ncbi:SagB/ThcOx family dehydrogenase [Methanosarcina sp. KYL-1]|uniref:nitroreductase family protein n=1 Tax=Methanosarcina sp. KYL-1 TaxID=2602068 RepID=UPI0021016ABA|nr:nitroreductase family protein [Methanosarcina sp. KYL-1]MCQ1536543.1 SagB/ThcOx family dehydrogenase [Methanosarcina sp. KYL-1]